MPEVENRETIPAIDDALHRLSTRLYHINTNLHDGLFGEAPTDGSDKEDTMIMPTASLSSIARRIKEIHQSLDTTENYVSNIHQNTNPVAG